MQCPPYLKLQYWQKRLAIVDEQRWLNVLLAAVSPLEVLCRIVDEACVYNCGEKTSGSE